MLICQADLIAFDDVAVLQLLNSKVGDVISLAGVITPVIDKGMDRTEPIALKITVRRVLNGYAYYQEQGKGLLFDWLK